LLKVALKPQKSKSKKDLKDNWKIKQYNYWWC
jgi:hypothetical protein